jgi:hypothetical protein
MVSQLPIELIDIICEYDARYVLEGKLTWQMLDKEKIYENPHPAAIEWILSQPLVSISWVRLGHNTHPDAVNLMLTHQHGDMISCDNCNDEAVAYILAHPRLIDFRLSANSHPLAISHLLAHPSKIDWEEFIEHDDARITDPPPYMPTYVTVRSHNTAILARAIKELEQLGDNEREYCICALCRNDHPMAINWLLAHVPEIDPAFAMYSSDNRIMKIALDHFNDNIQIDMELSRNKMAIRFLCNLKDGPPHGIAANPLIFKDDDEHRRFMRSL